MTKEEQGDENITSKSSTARKTNSSPLPSRSLPPPPPPPSNDQAYSTCSLAPPPPPPPPPPIDLPSPPTPESIPKSNDLNKSQQNFGSDRNELLEQIRGGIRLKKAETVTDRSTSSQTSGNSGNPLATALSRALENRFRVNQTTNDSSEDSNDCEEKHFNEWSD